jgi:hypothetical protein
VIHQQKSTINYSSRRPPPPPLPVTSKELNPVDILKPIFQFIDHQQQKQQQSSTSSLMSTYNSTDTALLQINKEQTDHPTENMFQLANVLQPQTQQQHVTSTRMTGISFISNGVQM